MTEVKKAKPIKIGGAARAAFKERQAAAKEVGEILVEIEGRDWHVRNPLPANVVFALGETEDSSLHQIVNALAAAVEESDELRKTLRQVSSQLDLDYYQDLLKELFEAVSERPTNK